MKKSCLFLIIATLSGVMSCFAQHNKIDSLLRLLKNDKEDTSRVIHQYKLCNQYRLIGKFNEGLFYGKKAITLAENIQFKKGIAYSGINIGLIYNYQGNYPEALRMFFSSLKIVEEMKDKYAIASTYNNIALIYTNQGNYKEALKMNKEALKARVEMKDTYGIAMSYNNIGEIYRNLKNYEESLKSHFASLQIKEELEDKLGIAASYLNIGNIYCDKGDYDKALKTHFLSLKLSQEMDDKNGITGSVLNIGYIYIKLKKVKEAEDYLNKALSLSKEIGSIDYIKETYAGLTVLDSLEGNYKAAFEHHKLFITYKDSIDNEEIQKKSLQASMQYEFDKKEIAAKAEQDKRDAINTEEKQKQRLIIYFVAGLLVLVGVFAVFMYNRFRITNHQKVIIEKQKVLVDKAYEELHEKNKEVMDSIHYAKRIQSALITSEKFIANSLNKLMKVD